MLTLKKAQSSAAAQAVAAVADEEQLAKMIRESADEKPLRTWDAEDVPAVCDSLARAYESISKLALAPQKSFQSFSSGIGLFAKEQIMGL